MGEEKEERERGVLLLNGLIEGMPVFVKELIAGGVAGGFAKTAVAPLERIKILFQTRRDEFRSLGLLGSFSKIAKTEGVLGFYRGNGASVARIVPYAALHYMAYEEYRRWIIFGFPDITRGPVLDLVAGSFAGGTAVLFTYPLDLVRTKLAYQDCYPQHLLKFGLITKTPTVVRKITITQLVQVMKHLMDPYNNTTGPENLARSFNFLSDEPTEGVGIVWEHVVESSKLSASKELVYKGIQDCFSKIYKEAGVRGLYRGVAPSLYGIFPYAGLKFYFYEEMKSHVPESHQRDITVKLACGSIAGLLGQTLTYPLDVVRRQMQVQQIMKTKSNSIRGTIETLVMIVQTQGWKQLFSGLSINYLKVVPSVAIGFTVYDAMKGFLQVPSRHETLDKRNSQPSSIDPSSPLSQTQQ